jgi:hypothetical protein
VDIIRLVNPISTIKCDGTNKDKGINEHFRDFSDETK